VDLHHVALRSVFAFVVLLALLRASGKRTLHQGTPFDFVLALILGDMIDDLLWADVEAARFVAAAGSLTLCHAVVGLLTARGGFLAEVIEGQPIVLVRAGALVKKGLRRERVSESEAQELLRVAGVERGQWHEVDTARIEESGVVSVIRKPGFRAAVRADLQRPGLRR
jgi:uncharacterized membrane protein YcaP (DUF421 family)